MVRLIDALAISGFLFLTAGLWLVSHALALIVAGLLLMAAGVMAHYVAPKRPSPKRRPTHVPRPNPTAAE